MRVTKKRLRQMIREAMMPGPGATPGQAITTADDEKSASGFSPEQKAAMGFMNNSMGPSPSADQLKGMGPELQSYAKDRDVDPKKMQSHLQQMLPATSSDHPHFQYDADSGAVGSTSGKKVYGENRLKITKRQLRRIIKEALEADRDFTAYGREDALSGRPESPPHPGGIGPDRREFHAYHDAYKKALLHQQDEEAAAEILNTRMGSYKGKSLPGGKKI